MRALCVDTSFLIDLWVEYHPPQSWPDLWDEVLPGLINEGILFAPHEVFQELSNKEASLKKWAHAQRKMFRVPDRNTCIALKDLLQNSPDAVNRFIRGPHADSLVAAMAKAKGAIAVTRERRDGTNPDLRKPRVHTLCQKCGVECYVTVREFREHINWPLGKKSESELPVIRF